MLLLGTRNATTQTLATGELVNLGSVYRRFCKKNACGVPAFLFDGNSITLNHSGIYHLTLTAIVSSATAGDVTIQLFDNGVAIPSALATETITTADTEFHTTVIDTYILVDKGCVLGEPTVLAKNITAVLTDNEATITNLVVNVDKVV